MDDIQHCSGSLLEDCFGPMLRSQQPIVVADIPAKNGEQWIRPRKIQRMRDESTSALQSTDGDESFLPADMPILLDPKQVDSIIAEEMASLSVEDREKVLYDIHGISGEVVETPELVQLSLHLLEIELSKRNDVTAYELAKQQNRAFVEDVVFLLKFLRADSFNVEKAAERIRTHFEVKLELFGLDLLTKDIIQDHLDKETIDVVYSGRLQGLRQRDRAGRIVGIRFMQPTTVSVMAQLRGIFYVVMIESEDEETQKKGNVVVSYLVGEEPNLLQTFYHRREVNLKMPKLLEAVPIRYVGIHVCHNHPLTWRLLLAIFKLAAKQLNRIRMREHCGDREECLLSLRSFGIPTCDFPLDEEGNITTEFHKSKMEMRRKLERIRQQELSMDPSSLGPPTVAAKTQLRVVTPGNYDVLLGRGKASYQHIGNVKFRRLVEERGPAYEEADVIGKGKISVEIVAVIRQSTGRFLKEDGAGWFEVPDRVSKRKIAHAFRTLRNRQQARGGTNLD